MAVFRSFYRMMKTALFALGVFVFAFFEVPAADYDNSSAQFVLYTDLTMKEVLGSFVGQWANMTIQDVINGFVSNGIYKSENYQSFIRCSMVNFRQALLLDQNLVPQKNWNEFNSFSAGIVGSGEKENNYCYDFVNQRVDCTDARVARLEFINSKQQSACNYLHGDCKDLFGPIEQACIQDKEGKAPCDKIKRIVSCWIEERPENGFFMSLPIVTGTNGYIVHKEDNTATVSEVFMDGPYFDTLHLTGVPLKQNITFDGFLLSAQDTGGNYYPLRYISSNGVVYNLFDNWYPILEDGQDSNACPVKTGLYNNHAAYDVQPKGAHSCGNGFEIFDANTNLYYLKYLYNSLPDKGFYVAKISGYDPTNRTSWVPVFDNKNGSNRLMEICVGIDRAGIDTRSLPICDIASMKLSNAKLSDYMDITNNGLALVAVWASDDQSSIDPLPPTKICKCLTCSPGYACSSCDGSCELVTYTITLDLDGGLYKSSTTINYNITSKDVVISEIPYKDGYDFVGWRIVTPALYWGNGKKPDEGEKEFTVPSGTYGDIQLKALYTQNSVSYTVNYNANGGSVSPTSATYTGTALTLPTPTRTNHTFDGWYTAASGGTRKGGAGSSYTPDHDNTTLYAHWSCDTAHNYYGTAESCTYCDPATSTWNGTTCVENSQETYNINYKKRDYYQTGYIHDGTYFQKYGPFDWYAINNINPSTYSYSANSQTITPAPAPSVSGYSFVGWCNNLNLEGTCSSSITIPAGSNETLNYYAKFYKENCGSGEYRNTNGECVLCPYEYRDGTDAANINECYRDWSCYVEPPCPDNATCSYVGTTSGRDYYSASSNPEHCKVVFSCNNGYDKVGEDGFIILAGMPTSSDVHGTLTEGEGDEAIPIPYAISLSGNSGLNSNYLDLGMWLVEFNDQQGSVYGSSLCSNTPGQASVAGNPDTSTEGQYCWCKTNTYSEYGSTTEQPASSQWVFSQNWQTTGSCKSSCATNCATRFDGRWNNSMSDRFRAALYGTMGHCELSSVSYTVTYDVNGGNALNPSSETLNAGSSITLPNPTRTGYDFIGWYDAQNNGNIVGSAGDSYTLNATITLYAQWELKEIEYTIYCNSEKNGSNGNIGGGAADYETNFNIGYFNDFLSRCSEYSTNNFTGWSCEHRYDNNVSPINYGNVNSLSWTYDDNVDIACYANWTPKIYTITLNHGDNVTNAGPDTIFVKYGVGYYSSYQYAQEETHAYSGTATISQPSREGYEFGGYYRDSDSTRMINTSGNLSDLAVGSSTAPYPYDAVTQSEQWTAWWTPIPYSITFNNVTQSDWPAGVVVPSTYTIQTATITLPTPVRAKHAFGGWYYNAQFTGSAITTIPQGSTGNKTLYAKWSCDTAHHYYGTVGSCTECDPSTHTWNGTSCEANTITCNAGYYLSGSTNLCTECDGSGNYYCLGDTFTPNGTDQGQTSCPQTTNAIEGARSVETYYVTTSNSGDANLADTIEDCTTNLTHGSNVTLLGMVGVSNLLENYNPTLAANTNNAVSVMECSYNSTDEGYTNCRYPSILLCNKGYYIENTNNWLTDLQSCQEGDNAACSSVEDHKGSPFACSEGEKDHYTTTYDSIRANPNADDTEIELYSDVGVTMMWGSILNLETGNPTTNMSEVYAKCPARYPYSGRASWKKAQCYTTIHFVSNGGNPISDIDYHYHDKCITLADKLDYHYSDASINTFKTKGYNSCWYGTDSSTPISDNCNDNYFDDMSAGDWQVNFTAYGTIKGKALCSSSHEDNYFDIGTPSNESGRYCWCKVESFVDTNNNTWNSSSSSWLYGDAQEDPESCRNNCAQSCAVATILSQNLRTALYTNTCMADDPNAPVASDDFPIPERNNYTFDGWYENSGLTGNSVLSFSQLQGTGEQTVYAKWTPNRYEVSFLPNSGSFVTGVSPWYNEYGSSILYKSATGTTTNNLPVVNRPGYTFSGWYTASSGGSQIYNASGTLTSSTVSGYTSGGKWVATESKTLYAQWTQIKINLSYIYNDDNDTVDTGMCAYNSSLTVPGIDNEEEVKPGYKFMGWIYRKE